MVEYANENFNALSLIQQSMIAQMMYRKETFATLLSGWNTDNIQRFALEKGIAKK